MPKQTYRVALVFCYLFWSVSGALAAPKICQEALTVQSALIEEIVSMAPREPHAHELELYVADLPTEVKLALLSQAFQIVPEMKAMRDYAKKRNYRLWLLGGSMASWVQFMRGHLLHHLGHPEFQSSRYAVLSFRNIFRTTQDVDIVIDADLNQGGELERYLVQKFPYLRGDFPIWEVLLLNQERGPKAAVRTNPQFLQSHNDSYSTAMIELTAYQDKKRYRPMLRDLRNWKWDWGKGEPTFFQDLWRGQLTYMYSTAHDKTARFKESKNPHVFSAIRYLTKLFHYGVEPAEGSMERIAEVLAAFSPLSDLPKWQHLSKHSTRDSFPYAIRWLKWSSKKLMKSPVDLEQAVSTYDQMGLRQKLGVVHPIGPATKRHTALWWMAKEPLRSYPKSEPSAGERTAKELGLDKVIRFVSVRDFVHFELLTWGGTHVPPSVYAEPIKGARVKRRRGFFVTPKEEAAMIAATAAAVQFRVDPEAVEGQDFVFLKNGQLAILNRAVLLWDETPIWNLKRYLQGLRRNPEELDEVNPMYVGHVRRQLMTECLAYSEEDWNDVVTILERSLEEGNVSVFKEVLSIKPELIEPRHLAAIFMMKKPVFSIVDVERIAIDLFSQPHWVEREGAFEVTETFVALLKTAPEEMEMATKFMLKYSLSQPHWVGETGFGLVNLISQGEVSPKIEKAINKHILNAPYWQKYIAN